MAVTPQITNEKLMDICVAFMKYGKASQVRDVCNQRWTRQGSDFRITREQVWPNLSLARKRGLIALTPEQHQYLGQQIAGKYGFEDSDIKVISARDDLSALASATAQIALKQLQIMHATMKGPKDRVHLGLGAGRTSALVSQHLANLLRTAEDVPPLTLHALSSGFDVEEPEKSPLAYFGYFRPIGKDIEYVGMFAPAAVRPDEYESVKTWPGVKEAFKRRREIDMVITSFASAQDPHGDLNRFYKIVKGSGAAGKNRVGDVQYRSYSATGPLQSNKGMRAVTLFELKDLVEMAGRGDKKVLLVAGPCAACGRSRADALRPLIERKSLKVWSQLVLDLDTAEAIRG